jgi:hypothetical protein
MVNHKREFTAHIIRELNLDISVDQAMKTWYVNLRDSGGFRLTELGKSILISHGIQNWNLPAPGPGWINNRLLLDLDQRVHWPYYVHKNGLIVFSSRDAVMAQLYGDIRSWVNSLPLIDVSKY